MHFLMKTFCMFHRKNIKQIPNHLHISYISKKVDTTCDTDFTIYCFLIVFINRGLRVSQLSFYLYMIMVDGWYSILTCICFLQFPPSVDVAQHHGRHCRLLNNEEKDNRDVPKLYPTDVRYGIRVTDLIFFFRHSKLPFVVLSISILNIHVVGLSYVCLKSFATLLWLYSGSQFHWRSA